MRPMNKQRARELQKDLLELAGELGRLRARLIQIAGEIPGGKQLDMPGAKPRTKIREGKIRCGGVKPPPTTPKPDVRPGPQRPTDEAPRAASTAGGAWRAQAAAWLRQEADIMDAEGLDYDNERETVLKLAKALEAKR